MQIRNIFIALLGGVGILIAPLFGHTPAFQQLYAARKNSSAAAQLDSCPSPELSSKEAAALYSLPAVLLGVIVLMNSKVSLQIKEQLKPINLLYNVITQYGTTATVTFCHELGHALAAKIINGDPVDIHLGATSSLPTKKPLLGKHSWLKLEGFSPTAGHAHFSLPTTHPVGIIQENTLISFQSTNPEVQAFFDQLTQEERLKILTLTQKLTYLDKKKYAVIMVAGGIAGILGYLLLRFATAYLKTKYTGQGTVKDALKDACAYDHVIFNQLSNIALPLNVGTTESDAKKVWTRVFNISQRTTNIVADYSFILGMINEFFLTFKEAQSAVSPSSPEDMLACTLLALVNTIWHGYVRFHA